MITETEIKSARKLVEASCSENTYEFFSKTRDVFQARLDTFVSRTEKYLEAAIIGEICNNTFDHNFDYVENYPRGAFFHFLEADNTALMADFGMGLKHSLSAVRKIENDLDAISLAFTEHITSRSLEDRGNGLKFVAENIQLAKWELFFQSGHGCCYIDTNGAKIYNSDRSVIGCFSIFKF